MGLFISNELILKPDEHDEDLGERQPSTKPRKSSILDMDNLKAKFLHTCNHWESELHPVCQLLTLYVLLILLTAIGGVIFHLAEYSTEQKFLDDGYKLENTIQNKFNETQMAWVKEWAKSSADFNETNMWQYRYAVFFSATTFSTTGFGFQAPKSKIGRAFTFFYGLPAIICYACIAKMIGELVLSFFEKIIISMGCIDSKRFKKIRIRLICVATLSLSSMMAGVIYITATDKGFGRGIDTYWNALYFLWTTTATIGFGDVMMSGSSTILTLLLGVWLAAVCGVVICLLSEVNEIVKRTAKISVTKSVNRLSKLRNASSAFQLKENDNKNKKANDVSNKIVISSELKNPKDEILGIGHL